MKARLFLSPLDGPLSQKDITEPTRITDLMPADVIERLSDGGIVRLNGHIIPPDRWHLVTVRSHANSEIDFVYVPAGKKTFALLATVALIAVTTAITAGFAAPFLGAAFAAGSFGATALAAGVSLAGSLAISALTAPPKAANQNQARELSQAGVSGNAVSLLEPLPVVIGKIGYSPPYLAPPYTYWDGDDVTAYAVVGVQGRCLIENIKINGLAVADIAGAEYEAREGVPVDAARTMFTQTVIEERDGTELTSFKTALETTKNEQLTDQTTPDNSAPKWHQFQTAGEFDEIVMRYLFPAGIVYTSTGTPACVALKTEIRKKGDVSWRALPMLFIADQKSGSGPMRCEIRIKREKPRGGRFICYAADEFPVFAADNKTAIGQSFEYNADTYFGTGDTEPSIALPFMTSATTSGVTMSASSEFSGTFAAWKASDSTGIQTYWRPTANSLPAWIKVDNGSAIELKSYQIMSDWATVSAVPTHAPIEWYLEGSNDNSTWTAIDDPIDISDYPLNQGWYNIKNSGSYRYYRWTFTANNGAANQELHVGSLYGYTDNAPCQTMVSQSSGGSHGIRALHSSGNTLRCKFTHLDKKGATIYLDPDEWDAGEYEVRIKRGWAFRYSLATIDTDYVYDSSITKAYYTDYQLVSGAYQIYAGQKNYRSDMQVEAFQTISTESPFDDTGIAMIAVSAPNIQISSIYADFTRYASEWDGSIWDATEVPTQNPAALYRQILLGGANAKPAPGESIDEDGLADWFTVCDTNGYQANAILQGASVGDAKQLIATAGYASPRDADTYGIVQDVDTSAEPVRFMLTPQNSKFEGASQELPDLPDAIRAEFNDESQSYSVEHAIVYRDGMDADTAHIFETVNYSGITDQTKVEARAAFDIRQAHLRQVRYQFRVGIDGMGLQRGTAPVGMCIPGVDSYRKRAAGWVTAITTSGGNVTSITLDNIMPWGATDEIEAVEDVASITDILDTSQPMGLAIRIPGGEVLLKQVSDVSDSNVCTFTTPFTYAGSGLEVDLEAVGLLVIAGQWGNVMRRGKVMSVVPTGYEERLVILADEAPGLFI